MSLGPVVMPLSCTNPDCTLPEGGVCARVAEFVDPMAECSDLARRQPVAPTLRDEGDPARNQDPLGHAPEHTDASVVAPASGEAAPWAGRHLDQHTLDSLLWSSPARILAVLGPRNAGKTSYLASLFLQLANGQCRELPYRFAGSRSLFGTHEILDKIRAWDQTGRDPSAAEQAGAVAHEIVAHTPKHTGVLHFLHLCLRPREPRDNRAIDVLLSDVAGEWFSDHTRQSIAEMDSFFARCDGFIVMADVALLMDKRKGRVHDAEIARMIRRALAVAQADTEHRRPRSLALVLGKYDLVVKDIMPPAPEHRANRDAWGALGTRCRKIWTALNVAREVMPVDIFPVSAFPGRPTQGQPVGVDRPLAFSLAHADARTPWPALVPPIPETASSFEAMRRWRRES